ncbi:MAG: cytochrome c biogenesis protein ResB [Planctomycetota bacterium]
MATNDTPEDARPRPGLTARLAGLCRRAWKAVRSVRVAAVLMGLIALACIVGTLIKQEPYDPAAMHQKYGRRLASLIGLLGLNQLYHTGWFIALLALFALSTTACAVSRLRLRARSIGFAVVHLSIVFILAGAIVKGAVGVEGVVRLREGQTVETFRTDAGERPLGFRLALDDFVLRRYEDAPDTEVLVVHVAGEEQPRPFPVEVGQSVKVNGEGTTIDVLRTLPHFMKDGERIYSASDRPMNPALQVRVRSEAGESTRWLFARFPDFQGHGGQHNGIALRYVRRPAPVKAFESHVRVLDEGGAAVKEATVMVNRPVAAGRYTLYQLSYDPQTEATSTLEVVYDPGVPLVYAGFLLMPVGMVFVFYVQPLLKQRKSRDV